MGGNHLGVSILKQLLLWDIKVVAVVLRSSDTGKDAWAPSLKKYSIDNEIKFSLINFSSIYGVISPKFDIYKDTNMTLPVEYAAIKSSLIHLTSYLTAYTKGSFFRVNSIAPGGILDDQDSKFLKKLEGRALYFSTIYSHMNFQTSRNTLTSKSKMFENYFRTPPKGGRSKKKQHNSSFTSFTPRIILMAD